MAVKPWNTLATAAQQAGDKEPPLTLHERDGTYSIRVSGQELMSSAKHGSEEAMPKIALRGTTPGGRAVLVGGLGMGYTLRSTLDLLGDRDVVTVVELSSAVVAWNRGVLAPLAGEPLEDPRVTLENEDIVRFVHKTAQKFDAVLLDVDNGPDGLTKASNSFLYSTTGLTAFHKILKPGGNLIVWSATPDPKFFKRFQQSGFTVREERVPVRPNSAARHILFVGVK